MAAVLGRSSTEADAATLAKSNKVNAIGGDGSIWTLPDLDYKKPVIAQGSLGKYSCVRAPAWFRDGLVGSMFAV